MNFFKKTKESPLKKAVNSLLKLNESYSGSIHIIKHEISHINELKMNTEKLHREKMKSFESRLKTLEKVKNDKLSNYNTNLEVYMGDLRFHTNIV